MKSQITMRTWVALSAALFLWASAYTGIRVGLKAYSPAHVALLRFLIASLVLAIFVSRSDFRPPRLRDVPYMALTGMFGISLYNLALNYGELAVNAGVASLLISSAPIWIALLSTIILNERLTIWGWGGVFVSFAGVAIIAAGEGGGLHFSPRALLLAAAALSSAIYIVMQKQLLRTYNALEVTTYPIWFGAVLLLPFGGGLVHTIRTAPLGSTIAIVYLGVFPAAIAFTAWAYALSHGPVNRISSFLYLVPVLAIVIAWVWLGEVPRAMSLVGGAIALAGVVIVNLWGKTQAQIIPITTSIEITLNSPFGSDNVSSVTANLEPHR
jgi:drug/metabolite transporter (DMT)-like permease